MAITNATRLSDFAAGIGTEGAILQIDNANQRIGIGITNPTSLLEVVGHSQLLDVSCNNLDVSGNAKIAESSTLSNITNVTSRVSNIE